MDPNQQSTAPSEETPVTPTPETPAETPQTSEAPVVTPVESIPTADTPTPTSTSTESTTEPAAPVVTTDDASTSSLSTANPGFAFGLTSLILALLSIGLFAVIFGILGLRKSKKVGQGNGLAIAGLIIGGIEVVFGLIAIIFILIALPSLKFSE